MLINAFRALSNAINGEGNAWAHYDGMSVEDLKTLDKDCSTRSDKQYDEGAYDCSTIITSLYSRFGVPPNQQKIPISVDSLVATLIRYGSKHPSPDEENNDLAHLKAFAAKRKNYQLVRTLKAFNEHLKKGGTPEELAALMTVYDKNMSKADTDFYKTTIDSDPALGEVVGKILDTLGVTDPRVRSRYIEAPLEVRDFLKEVSTHLGNEQNKDKIASVKDLARIINDKARISKQKALLFGLLGFLPIAGGMSYNGFGAIDQLVTAAAFVPAVGLVGAVGAAGYAIYESVTRKNVPAIDKLRDNALIVAGTGIKIAAYGLALAAAVTASPVAAALTVVAAGVAVVRETAKLISLRRRIKEPKAGGNLQDKQNQARLDEEYSKTKKTVGTRLGAAILLAGLTAVACFVPGGIFVTIGVGIAVGLVCLAQWAAEKAIIKSNTGLEARFKKLEAEDRIQNGDNNGPQVDEGLTSDARAAVGLAAHHEAAPAVAEVAEPPQRAISDEGYAASPVTPVTPVTPAAPLSRDALDTLKHKVTEDKGAAADDVVEDDAPDEGPKMG